MFPFSKVEQLLTVLHYITFYSFDLFSVLYHSSPLEELFQIFGIYHLTVLLNILLLQKKAKKNYQNHLFEDKKFQPFFVSPFKNVFRAQIFLYSLQRFCVKPADTILH